MSEPARSYSLVSALTFYLSLVLGALLVLIIAGATWLSARNIQATSQLRLEQIASDLPAVLELPVWNVDLFSIKAVGEAFGRDRNLARLKISQFDGEILYLQEDAASLQDEGNLVRTVPVHFNGDLIAMVELVYTQRHNRDAVLGLVGLALLLTVLILGVVFFAIRVILAMVLKKPLGVLNQVADNYQADYYRFESTTVPIKEFLPFERVLNQLGNRNYLQLVELRELNERLHRQAEEITQLNVVLEQRVVERTAQLEAANKELEAFSYTVSHDLRAPLRHIDGYVELLLKRCRDGLSEKGVHYVDTIASSARQMGALVDDLLQFSRMGRSEMRQESLDMNQVVKECLGQLQADCAGRAVEWSIADLPVVKGDYALFRQVWVNLMGNAVKYSRKRDIARIEIDCRAEDGVWLFRIKDNGVGFDMQYAGKLFGVFQRLHAQEDFEGTGIGLATVQRIINRHGGRIWAESEPDRGATFCFTLPRAG